MLTILCVLKAGGIYSAEWVRKLRDAAERNIEKHRFVCLSDMDVPCERIALEHDWPGWWSKVEIFRPGVVTDQVLYLDLDTVLTAPVDVTELRRADLDFAMLQNFWNAEMVGSGVMWFSGHDVPHHVYEKFKRQPKAYIAHHERNRDGPYCGDQAFIFDALGRDVAFVNDYLPGIKSYKMHCKRRLPADAAIICFHGLPRISDLPTDNWVFNHWK